MHAGPLARRRKGWSEHPGGWCGCGRGARSAPTAVLIQHRKLGPRCRRTRRLATGDRRWATGDGDGDDSYRIPATCGRPLDAGRSLPPGPRPPGGYRFGDERAARVCETDAIARDRLSSDAVRPARQPPRDVRNWRRARRSTAAMARPASLSGRVSAAWTGQAGATTSCRPGGDSSSGLRACWKR